MHAQIEFKITRVCRASPRSPAPPDLTRPVISTTYSHTTTTDIKYQSIFSIAMLTQSLHIFLSNSRDRLSFHTMYKLMNPHSCAGSYTHARARTPDTLPHTTPVPFYHLPIDNEQDRGHFPHRVRIFSHTRSERDVLAAHQTQRGTHGLLDCGAT